MDHTIHTRAHKATLAQVLEDPLMMTLATTDHRSADLDCITRVSIQDLLHQGLGSARGHRFIATGTVGGARPRIEDAQMVGDFGQSADGGARSPRHGPLIHGNRRSQAFNGVNIRLPQVPQELPRIRGQCLKEAPLALAEQGVESQ